MIAGASSSAQLFKERDLLHVGSHDTPTSESLSTYITPNKKNINVFGVIFDQKLQWSDQVAQCIAKSNKALTAIRMIK